MALLQYHYKDRDPKETINIVQDFFQKRNFVIKEKQFIHSEINTYSCQLYLYYNNILILQANGKGLTPELCLASGFGELYERFCYSSFECNINPFNIKYTTQERKNKYNYYFQKNEKQMTYESILDDPYSYKLFENCLPEISEKYIKQFTDIFMPNGIYNNEYINIANQNDKRYFNFIFATYLCGTTGLAAGNTLEEALTQGASELYERLTIEDFYTKEQQQYYYLDENVFNDQLREIINNIKNVGYEVKIFDLSYNFQMPVCMIMIQDKKNYNIYFNFGSFPIFDIAVERCLTEIYQGVKFLPVNTSNLFSYDISQNRNEIIFNTYRHSLCNNKFFIFNDFFNKIKKIDTYNISIFNNSLDVLQSVKMINKNININMYYSNISLSSEIVAVSLLLEPPIQARYFSEYLFSELKNFDKQFLLDTMSYIPRHIQNDNYSLLINFIKHFQSFNQSPINILDSNTCLSQYLGHILYPISFLPTAGQHDIQNLFLMMLNDINFYKIYFSEYGIYRNLFEQFLLAQQGVSEEIIKKLGNNFNKELISTNSLLEIITLIFIEPMKQQYNTEEYKQFINNII